MSFEICILGSGAALPTAQRNPSSQYINCNERHILIDCGEGTQNQIRRNGIKIQKISHILISHLHGDHFFGLVGLLSTMHLLGRTAGIHIYGPEGLEQIIRLQLELGGNKTNFDLHFTVLPKGNSGILFEDSKIEIHYFPLKHRIPTTGFLIQEKKHEFKIIGEALKESGVSLMAIPFFRRGEDYVDETGEVFEASAFTFAPPASKSYAYCSDTMYYETILPFITGVDCLYHEATFLHDMLDRARATFHTTAKQAGQLAAKAGVKKLLLGHLSARYESGEAHQKEAAEFHSNVSVVEDKMWIQL